MVTAKHLPMRWSKKVWLSGLLYSGKVLGTMRTYACECVQRQVLLVFLALFVHSWWNLKMKHKGRRAEPPVNYCLLFFFFLLQKVDPTECRARPRQDEVRPRAHWAEPVPKSMCVPGSCTRTAHLLIDISNGIISGLQLPPASTGSGRKTEGVKIKLAID